MLSQNNDTFYQMAPVRDEAETGVQGLFGKVTMEKREKRPEKRICLNLNLKPQFKYSLTFVPADVILGEISASCREGGEEEEQSEERAEEELGEHVMNRWGQTKYEHKDNPENFKNQQALEAS